MAPAGQEGGRPRKKELDSDVTSFDSFGYWYDNPHPLNHRPCVLRWKVFVKIDLNGVKLIGNQLKSVARPIHNTKYPNFKE